MTEQQTQEPKTESAKSMKAMSLKAKCLKLDARDNVGVALEDLSVGEECVLDGQRLRVAEPVPAKHKFALEPLTTGAAVTMYGVLVGRARTAIPVGGLLKTANLAHESAEFSPGRQSRSAWAGPDVARWREATFEGYRRADGQVGTRNYWLVIPLVFCENRNVEALRDAFEEELGYARTRQYRAQVSRLVADWRGGSESHQSGVAPSASRRVFEHLDGIRFLTHQGGCGGTRDDARALCGLLAGYIHHPNVAGATVLSLGCQHAQPAMLREELEKRGETGKPVLVFTQQEAGTEQALLERAIAETFAALAKANEARRAPAPLSALAVGLKCGGSDGFSGISANPAIGHLSDLVVALGGRTILSEFPELCGVEQELIDRCQTDEDAQRFASLMRAYEARARAVDSGFEMNPSPGNIRDGLVTDAMKSAGAARKGGTAPVADVLDYPEYMRRAGLTLLCTPGNDVEAVTGQVGAGATVVLFTTGLGTPTGNPIAPVIKLATNARLAQRMPDIIDVDTSAILRGEATVEAMGEQILAEVIEVASGRRQTQAERLRQEDFIPWKRGVSL